MSGGRAKRTRLARTHHHGWVMGGAERGTAMRRGRRGRLGDAEHTGRQGARGERNASRTGRSSAGSGKGMERRRISIIDTRNGQLPHSAVRRDQIALNIRVNLIALSIRMSISIRKVQKAATMGALKPALGEGLGTKG